MKKRMLSLLLAICFACSMPAIAATAEDIQPAAGDGAQTPAAADTQAAGADPETYNHYAGLIHEHTTDSDGTGTPDEAYEKAKNVLGLDFFGLSDHSHYYNGDEEYAEKVALAKTYDEEGKFVSMPGFEMTWSSDGGWWGHMNTYDTKWVQLDRTASTSLEDYYAKIVASPESFSQFNHPGYDWGEFDDYNFYSKENDDAISLIETKSSKYEADYVRALDKGWHVSPMYQDDNHSGTWGDDGGAGIVLAKNLTHADLVEAINANRTYSSQDRTLRLEFTGNGSVMGSRLSGIDKLTLNVKVDYEKDTVGTIRIISNGGLIVAEKDFDGSTADWTVDVPVGDNIYYFARLITGNNKYAVSAPIWVENGKGLVISDTDIGMNQKNSAMPYEVKFNLKNTDSVLLSNISVELYRAGVKDGDTYLLPQLAAGATKEIRLPAAYIADSRDVNIVVKCADGEAAVTDTSMVNLPDLLMTEFLASTWKDGEVAEGYQFLEVYNATPEEKNLKDYKLTYYTQRAETLTFDITDSVKIPAYHTAVIWLKDQNNEEITALTKSDFAKYYKNTVQVSQIVEMPYAIAGAFVMTSRNGHGFYLVSDGGARSEFVRYNQGYQWGEDVYSNSSLKYTYTKDGRPLGILLENTENVTPGSVTAAQIPYAAEGATLGTDSAGDVAVSGGVVTGAALAEALTAAKGDTVTAYSSVGDAEQTVTIEAAAVKALADSTKSLYFETGIGGVVIKNACAKALAGQNADIAVKLAKSGDNALTISATAGGTELTSFESPLLLTVVYTGADDTGTLYATKDGAVLTQSVFSDESGSMLIKVSAPGTYGIAAGKAAFEDTTGNWAASYISFLASRGIVGGASGKFSPASQITRAEFTKILATTAGADVSSYKESTFTDVAAEAWYMPYVAWAADRGIVTGSGNGTFAPNGKITRKDMAVMLSRLAGKVLGYPLQAADETKFSDDASIDGYAKDAVYAMKASGILGGKENGKFDPNGNATRAEAAKMISVLIGNLVTK